MIGQTSQRSMDLFESGFYCAESVLLALAEANGVQSDLIPRIATGFCSGMARTCGTCGAVTGAIISLNLATGRSSPAESVDRNYALVQRLIRAFEQEFGSTNCADLIGCDVGSAEGQEFYAENNLVGRCKHYTGEAVRIALSLLVTCIPATLDPKAP
jgi:C_GCAxxG_C_C family probable redox protein